MALKIFNPKTVPTTYTRSIAPSFSIYHKNGQFSFNRGLSKQLDLKAGSQLELAQDDENLKMWFITKSQSGFALREKSGRLVFSSSSLGREIFESHGGGKSIRATVAPKAVKIAGVSWYQLEFYEPKK